MLNTDRNGNYVIIFDRDGIREAAGRDDLTDDECDDIAEMLADGFDDDFYDKAYDAAGIIVDMRDDE